MTTLLWLCLVGTVVVVAIAALVIERDTGRCLRIRLGEMTDERNRVRSLLVKEQAANAALLEKLNKIKEVAG